MWCRQEVVFFTMFFIHFIFLLRNKKNFSNFILSCVHVTVCSLLLSLFSSAVACFTTEMKSFLLCPLQDKYLIWKLYMAQHLDIQVVLYLLCIRRGSLPSFWICVFVQFWMCRPWQALFVFIYCAWHILLLVA